MGAPLCTTHYVILPSKKSHNKEETSSIIDVIETCLWKLDKIVDTTASTQATRRTTIANLSFAVPALFFRHVAARPSVVLPPSALRFPLSLYPLSPDRCSLGTKGNKVMERNDERGRLAGFHRPLLAATRGQQRARARAEQPLRYGKPTALMTDRVTVRPRPLRYLHKHHTVTAPSKSEGRARCEGRSAQQKRRALPRTSKRQSICESKEDYPSPGMQSCLRVRDR